MANKRYCAYNKTTGSFLSIGVIVFDTSLEPLNALGLLVDVANLNGESGFWLKPLRNLPAAHISSPSDLVYLDKDYSVVQGIELHPAGELAPFKGQAASALVLAPHTIHLSQTRPGDQLIICDARSLVRHFARDSDSTTPAPSQTRNPRANGGPASFPWSEWSWGQHAALRPLDEGDEAEYQPQTTDSLKSQSPRWGEETRRPLADDPHLITPVPVTKTTEPTAAQPHANWSSASSLVGNGSREQQAARQQVGGQGIVELTAEEIESVTSRLLRLGEETRLARIPASTIPAAASNGTQPPAAQLHGNGGSASSPADDQSREKQVSNQPLDGKNKADIEAWEQNWLNAWFQRLGAETRLARTPASISPAPVTNGTESPAARPHGNGGSASSAAGDHSREQQATNQPLNEQGKVRFLTRDINSLISRGLRPGEEARLAGTLVSPTQAAVTKSTESPANQPGANDSPAALPAGDRSGKQQAAIQPSDGQMKAESRASMKESLASRLQRLTSQFQNWIDAGSPSLDRRRSPRRHSPGLVAYFWTGGAPEACTVRDISSTGFFLFTEMCWSPETMILMNLQKTDAEGRISEDSLPVMSKVVRRGLDGVGYEFIGANKRALEPFL